MSFLQAIKSVDFYRKLKKDLQQELTEASITGAALSLVAAVIMIGLIVAEFSSFLAPTTESKVILDHFESSVDDTLQINFNITFPHLKCEFASVDATNFMGTHDAGLAARVSKIRLDEKGKIVGKHEEPKKEVKHEEDAKHEGPETALQLTTEAFETNHHKYDVMIVNFFAPWCHWCQKLAPVWEQSAKAVGEKHGDNLIVLAKVDCTATESESLCIKYRIDAFPTILVFRKDDSGTTQHESYHGERSVKAITGWADHFVAQEKKEIPKTRSVDVNKDGVADSHTGVGCMISGLLHVQRAPGMLKIQASSGAHDFNWETMDVSHMVNHLSFGPFLSEQAWMVLPPHIAASVGALDDRSFTSDQHVPTTHEHYVKVVRHEVSPPSSWKVDPVTSYGYVVHSNNIQKEGEVPTVRLNYDILPIVVSFAEKKQAVYHFITQLCAIVGGVFTVAGITATIMDKGINAIRKKEELGKLG